MKTLVVYTTSDDIHPQYFLLEGNYSHLDDVVINSTHSSDEDQEEALRILRWDDEIGDYKQPMSKVFPLEEVKNNDVVVVHIGFLS